jgi:RhtB (resistance to homoserine/threonine) family protein
MNHEHFLMIGIIALLGAMSPGPDFAIVTKNALQYSRRSAYFTVLGIMSALLIHVTYCILGLGVVIKNSIFLFTLIKYVGAAYLIYLGIKALLNKIEKSTEKKQGSIAHDLKPIEAFKQGFLTNILNPKCIIFILSIFTLVVEPGTPYWAQCIYGAELSFFSGLWFGSFTFFITHPLVYKRIMSIQPVIVKILGVFLIALGVHLFTVVV